LAIERLETHFKSCSIPYLTLWSWVFSWIFQEKDLVLLYLFNHK